MRMFGRVNFESSQVGAHKPRAGAGPGESDTRCGGGAPLSFLPSELFFLSKDPPLASRSVITAQTYGTNWLFLACQPIFCVLRSI